VSTQEPIVAEVITQVPIVEEVVNQEFSVEDVVLEDYVCFEEDTEHYNDMNGEAGFTDVAGSVMDSSGFSHDESFGVDDLDLDLNLNEPNSGIILAEVSTQEPIVAEVITQVPIVEEVVNQEFSVEDVVLEDYVCFEEDAEHYNGEFDESAPSDGRFFFDDEGIDCNPSFTRLTKDVY
nr:hypothetical protein [Tanacetum cinerariifolium]